MTIKWVRSTYFCELRRLDLSLVLLQLSSFGIAICKFFSGSIGDGIDLVEGDGGPSDPAMDFWGRARVKGGSRAFSAPSCEAAECSVKV